MSGVDLPDGRIIRKGAVSAVVRYVAETFGAGEPPGSQATVEHVSLKGATPWWLRWTDTFLE